MSRYILTIILLTLLFETLSTSLSAQQDCPQGYEKKDVRCDGNLISTCIPENYVCDNCWKAECANKDGTYGLFHWNEYGNSYNECLRLINEAKERNERPPITNTTTDFNNYRIYLTNSKFCNLRSASDEISSKLASLLDGWEHDVNNSVLECARFINISHPLSVTQEWAENNQEAMRSISRLREQTKKNTVVSLSFLEKKIDEVTKDIEDFKLANSGYKKKANVEKDAERLKQEGLEKEKLKQKKMEEQSKSNNLTTENLTKENENAIDDSLKAYNKNKVELLKLSYESNKEKEINDILKNLEDEQDPCIACRKEKIKTFLADDNVINEIQLKLEYSDETTGLPYDYNLKESYNKSKKILSYSIENKKELPESSIIEFSAIRMSYEYLLIKYNSDMDWKKNRHVFEVVGRENYNKVKDEVNVDHSFLSKDFFFIDPEIAVGAENVPIILNDDFDSSSMASGLLTWNGTLACNISFLNYRRVSFYLFPFISYGRNLGKSESGNSSGFQLCYGSSFTTYLKFGKFKLYGEYVYLIRNGEANEAFNSPYISNTLLHSEYNYSIIKYGGGFGFFNVDEFGTEAYVKPIFYFERVSFMNKSDKSRISWGIQLKYDWIKINLLYSDNYPIAGNKIYKNNFDYSKQKFVSFNLAFQLKGLGHDKKKKK